MIGPLKTQTGPKLVMQNQNPFKSGTTTKDVLDVLTAASFAFQTVLNIDSLSKFTNLRIIFYRLVLGANINAQTEETQETALTLACCGGFLEVADFLIKAGADIELGCSTPLMEAAQEGHLELVKYLLAAGEALRRM